MLYDAFICHAFEDKAPFVRPLAEALRSLHVEVWYDEFTLKLGDSIRRSIDRGLLQSRFGIVVLSPSFFAKNWPQYELDGLLERELSRGDTVILPVWHNIDRESVSRHSPPLASRVAANSRAGLAMVVDALIKVIRPRGSPLVIARDTLINWGGKPPVVTDPFWLNIVEASNRIPAYGATIPEASHWGRWSFPLPAREGEDPFSWGERLAWTAMQSAWCDEADSIPISVVTQPNDVLAFIDRHPGLLETCLDYPDLAAEYAPQLTIRGFGGPLEEVFEERYQESIVERHKDRIAGSTFGSGLTTDGNVPKCDVEWALRDPEFGGYTVEHVAENYFHADGIFGPPVSYHEDAVHVFWLLSSSSSWLPAPIRTALHDGLAGSYRHWVWGEHIHSERRREWESWGELGSALWTAYDTGVFEWSPRVERDVLGMSTLACRELALPESPAVLVHRFRDSRFPERNAQTNFELAHGKSRGRRSRKSKK